MKPNHFQVCNCHRSLAKGLILLSGVWAFAAGLSTLSAEPMQGTAESAAAVAKANARQAIEQQVAALPEGQRAQLLELVNQGSEEALAALPGIAGSRSKAIQAARPFGSIEDLLRVPGIGTATLSKILKQGPVPASSSATGSGAGSGSMGMGS